MTDPHISVIVPCYRAPGDLADLLSSLRVQSPVVSAVDFEVVVVDSGLDDLVLATAERFGVRCLRGDAPLLPGEARNLGAQHARGTGLAFIDADCVAESGWITAVAGSLRTATMSGGPVLNRLPWHTVASVDNLLQFADFGAARPTGPIRHVPACNMAMRRDDFLALGGFVHRGQPSGEDVLLTEAVNDRRPGPLMFVPEMRVAHLGRRSLATMLRHQRDFGYTRGALGLRLTAGQRRWAARALVLPAVALKHLAYVCRQGVRHGQTSVPRLVVVMPTLLLGAIAWALGLRAGLRAAARDEASGSLAR